MSTPQSDDSRKALALKQENSVRDTISPFAGEHLISRAELRRFVDASDMTVWRWVREGKFPHPIYIGPRRYWRATDIGRWLDSKLTQSARSRLAD